MAANWRWLCESAQTSNALTSSRHRLMAFVLMGLGFTRRGFHLPNSSGARRQREESKSAILTERELRERERQNVLAALTQADWRIHGEDGAAESLGLKTYHPHG